jgi:peptidoglycan/LPS O-acetylase OafA/YrhL
MELVFERLPIVSCSAFAGYALMASFLIPSIRRWATPLMVLPSPSTGFYMAPLDGFRGLAAFLVVMYHASIQGRPVYDATADILPFVRLGEKSVPIFCVLSGFLIFRSLARSISVEGIRHYVKKRILRIFPLYAATLVGCLIIGALKIYRIPGELFMLHGIGFPYLSNPVAWSLFVEVVFYALLPTIVVSAGSRILALSVCAVAVLAWSDMEGPRHFALWKYFFIGIISSELFDRYRQRLTEKWAIVLFAIGLALFALDFKEVDWFGDAVRWSGRYCFSIDIPISHYTVGLGVSFALIMIGAVSSRGLARVFGSGPLRIMGVISYSAFLLHDFIIVADLPLSFDGMGRIHGMWGPAMQELPPAPAWFVPLVILPAVFFWATVSFLLIERPFLLMRPKQEKSINESRG